MNKKVNWFRVIGIFCVAIFAMQIFSLEVLFLFNVYPEETTLSTIIINFLIFSGAFYTFLNLFPNDFIFKPKSI